ncbi:prepilin peptidase [Sporosarcina sp. FSL K6-5500]|uniref:prepilin peptidase n=1 Tax=Sporosarcina sp. FSL K6-5500 TaxID=2921558 RepID=UPI0030F6458D
MYTQLYSSSTESSSARSSTLLANKESIVSPHSYYTTCDQKLRFLDLVPVFSILNRV